MKKILLFIVCIVVLFIIGISVYVYELSPLTSNSKIVEVNIPKGMSGNSVATILMDKKIIKSDFAFKIYLNIHKINSINYGLYELNSNMDVKEIISVLSGPGITKKVKILFKEGSNIRSVAKTISLYTNNSIDDVYNLLDNEKYINGLISKYWFLTDVIKDKDIYYPLEGYLSPDTYIFDSQDVSVEVIFKSMLDQMNKILTPYKNSLGNKTIHEYLTIASILEEEGKTLDDRKLIAGVFNNRLAANDSLGSDVTTYYAVKLDNYVRDLKDSEIDTYNPYNTRGPKMGGKLPIGPISAPGATSVEAAIKPAITDYYYFVSDKNGKLYFTKTNSEHEAMIRELKSKKLWYTY